jgi:hypothetical protein
MQIPAAIITTILLLDSTFNHFNFSKSSYDIFEMGAPGKKMWSFVTQIFNNGQPSYGGDSKIFNFTKKNKICHIYDMTTLIFSILF